MQGTKNNNNHSDLPLTLYSSQHSMSISPKITSEVICNVQTKLHVRLAILQSSRIQDHTNAYPFVVYGLFAYRDSVKPWLPRVCQHGLAA